jgi:hypothetical protein
MDWETIINDGELNICSAQEAQAKGVYPNRLGWLKKIAHSGSVVPRERGTHRP